MTNKNTFGNRLKLARERERYSRPALSKATGIPVKSLEKYEYDEAPPNIDRLRDLADKLNVTTEYLMHGQQEFVPTGESPEAASENEPSKLSVLEQLKQLDDMRLKGFSKFWRSAPRLFAIVEAEIGSLNSDELLDLAEARQLAPIKNVGAFEAVDRDETVHRVLDTAYFGVDLHYLEQSSLEELAEEFNLEPDIRGIIFSHWSDIRPLASALRIVLREGYLKHDNIDLTNELKFPKLECT